VGVINDAEIAIKAFGGVKIVVWKQSKSVVAAFLARSSL
jgi:hypothetical protein